MERPLALVVDGDPAVRALICNVLEQQQLKSLGASGTEESGRLLERHSVDIVIVDLDTPGAEDLVRSDEKRPGNRVVIVMASASDETRAAQLIRAGAFDVLVKPFEASYLKLVAQRALRQRELLRDLRRLRRELQVREGYQGIVGRSASMERLRQRLEQLASSELPVCFAGEVGTGKELAARTLVSLGGRERAFVKVPCSELTDAVWEARWLGDVTVGPRLAGFLEQARGGALYIEGITELSPRLQERLVETLEAGAERGDSGPFRVLSGSVTDPAKALEQGHLVEGLERIVGETLHVPPLRERAEDIPLLAGHFIASIGVINDLPPLQLSPEALSLLERYRWPTNVQELQHALEQAVILSPDGFIRPRDLPDRIREAKPWPSAKVPVATARRFREAKRGVVEEFERSYLWDLMESHSGNVTAASQQAGMLRSALQRLLRKYGLKSAGFRRPRRAVRTADATRTRVE